MIFSFPIAFLVIYITCHIMADNKTSNNNNQIYITSLEKCKSTVTSRASAALSYQEFLINEASYKFWAIFQLVTVAVLLYSTFAAIYYARYNYLMNLEKGEYEDLLFRRSFMTKQNFQTIVDAITDDYKPNNNNS